MSNNNVKEIDDLIKIISKLPGLGPKSAKRIVLKLINNREELIKPLANILAQVYKNIVRCNICGNIKSSNSSCTFQTCSYSDKNFVRTLSEKLLEWTGNRWVITLAKETGQKTFSEMKKIKEEEHLEEEKKGKVYKKFKNIFSDAELLEVKKQD